MPVFKRSCLLPVTLERAFRFHEDTGNLARVQPGWAPVTGVSASGPAAPGTQLRISCGGLLPQTWRVEIEEIQPPAPGSDSAWIIDRALESPFPRWRHQHHFQRVPGGTRMTDRIEFQPPLGRAGLLLLPGIRLVFLLLFNSRHRRTRALLLS